MLDALGSNRPTWSEVRQCEGGGGIARARTQAELQHSGRMRKRSNATQHERASERDVLGLRLLR